MSSATASEAEGGKAPYPVRLTGSFPPPPNPSSRGGGGGGRRSKAKPVPAPPPRQQRHVLDLSADHTLAALKLDAFRLFSVNWESYDATILGGYPPRELAGREGEEGGGSVRDLGVVRNETLIVRFVPRAAGSGGGVGGGGGVVVAGKGGRKRSRGGAAAASSSSASGDATEDAAPEKGPSDGGCGGRAKRAAAEAASSNFAAVIAAQDALLRKENAKKRGGGGGRKPKRSGPEAEAERERKRANLAKAREAAARKRTFESMNGRRLCDGQVLPAAEPRRACRSSCSSGNRMKSEEDVSYALLNSLGEGGGKVGTFLRAAMKGAVGKSYEASRAAARVAAVAGGKVKFEPMAAPPSSTGGGVGGGQRLGGAEDSNSGRKYFEVKYSKGVEGRGDFKEEVEILSPDALAAVVKAVHADHDDDDIDGGEGDASASGREMLESTHMAQLSPRVFWSLAYHYSALRSTDEALKELCPDLDWTCLDGRAKKLSEKARENLRQERAAKGEDLGDEGREDALEAVEAVEKAMEGAASEDGESARERAARAARLARFGTDSGVAAAEETAFAEVNGEAEGEDEWTLVTPDETDVDELIECITEGTSAEKGTRDPTVWAELLVERCAVRNWRELANADDKVLLKRLSHSIGLSSSSSPPSDLSETVIEQWIENAQTRSIDEIMLEILDGDQDALEILREHCRSGTPKDLALWKTIPGMLLSEAKASPRWNEEKFDDGRYTEEIVGVWCRRAKVAMETLDWLGWYATPI